MAALVAILLLGVGLRLGEAWDGRSPVYDAVAYAAIAANLERGDGFTLGAEATQPAGNYSPGLPLLVAGLYALSGGEHERFARLALALIGALAVLFAYLIGRRLAESARLTRERSLPPVAAGLLGAAAVAIYPALLEYQGMLMGEPLAATLLSGAVLAMLWAGEERAGALPGIGGARASRLAPEVERGCAARETDCISPLRDIPGRAPARSSVTRWLAPGLLMGALVLVRPEYLAIAVSIAVVVAARRGLGGWRACGVQAVVMLMGVVVVVAPWTVRNAVTLDRFVPVSTGGGQVLFAGSYLPSGGDPERVGREVLKRHPELTPRLRPPRGSLVPLDGVTKEPRGDEMLEEALAEVRLEQILAALAAERHPGMETDEALARMGRERLREAISERPLEYAGFVAAKLWRTWGHGPRNVMREPGWAAYHWALLAFAALGLGLLARRRSWAALLIGAVLLAVTATGALLVASPRRVLVTIPLLAPLAGVGAAASWAWLRSRIRH